MMKPENRFLNELLSLKEQMRFGGRFKVPEGMRNVVVAGMGGSGIVGRMFQEIYTELPVGVVSDYNIPRFVNRDTLFVAVSYSGNTIETLSACRQAKKQGAEIVAVTSGGALAKEIKNQVLIPKGLQPRSALGYMLMPLLNSFMIATNEDVEETYNILEGLDSNNSDEGRLANEIYSGEHIPVVYGTSPYNSVAYRWSTQFNENAKLMLLWANFPELNHNNTMALRDTYRKQLFYHICILSNNDPRLIKRVEATEAVTGTRFRKIIKPKGRSELAKLMSLVHIGDYVTYHLAKLRGVDPMDVSAIEELKVKLANNA